MSIIDAIGQQVSHLGEAFEAAGDEETKLTAIETELADLELRFWLTENKDAAIFCVELDRLRTHLRAEPSPEGWTILRRGLEQMKMAQSPRNRSGLLQTVNSMRVVRGKPALERANNLVQAQRHLWREMQRRTNIPRRLQRHLATVTDLLDAANDAEKCQRALPLLSREADALHRLFRLDPSSVIWGSLRRLSLLAIQSNTPLSLPRLRDYCQSPESPSGGANTLFAAWPVLIEISEQIEPLDPRHVLPKLMKTPLEEFEQGAKEETSGIDAESPGETPSAPIPKNADMAHAPQPQQRIEEALPSEVHSLSRATENLSLNLAEGVLEESSMPRAIEELSKRVLNAYAERSLPLADFTPFLEHLCEVVDLAASGVEVSDTELKALASRLEQLLAGPQVLSQIDQALDTLSAIRTRLTARTDKAVDSDLAQEELDQLLRTVERIEQSQGAADEPNERRLFGYLLRRGELHYVLEQREDIQMRHFSAEEAPHDVSLLDLKELFPQVTDLAQTTERVLIEQGDTRLSIACDQVTGPRWLDLRSPFVEGQGLTFAADGRSLCVLSAERLLASCQ